MDKKIIVAGHVCLDITPVFLQHEMTEPEKLLTPGKLVSMHGVDMNIGGAVSNTGLGLKKLGADVLLMGKVGTDDFGEIVIRAFEKHQAEEGMIISPDTNTSYSVVLAPPGTDRIFLHDPGTNDTFDFEDLDMEKIKGAALFHFGYPPIMRKMYENDGEGLLKIFKAVKEMGVSTSLDMAAIDEDADAGKADWEAILKKVLPYVDFFVPSVEELSFMIDKELYRTWKKRSDNKDLTLFVKKAEVESLGEKLLSWGAKIVMIKCGAPGMYLITGDEDILNQVSDDLISDTKNWSNIRWFEKSYVPEKILSGTGAGDTSIAAFLYAITKKYSWEKCIQLAAGTGASCVTAYDAISGLKSFDELSNKIDGGWEKQNLLLE